MDDATWEKTANFVHDLRQEDLIQEVKQSYPPNELRRDMGVDSTFVQVFTVLRDFYQKREFHLIFWDKTANFVHDFKLFINIKVLINLFLLNV